jgi:TPR repeat protein
MKIKFVFVLFVIMMGLKITSYGQNSNIKQNTQKINDDDRKKKDSETTEQYVERIKVMAEQGDVITQKLFAYLYLGEGDFAEAATWFRKVAEEGDAEAQCQLGTLYQEGRGVAQSYAEALKWYRKAAEQKYAVAQYEIGNMYQFGQEVPTNVTEAVKWYRKAAEQGLAHAQFNLGCNYMNGKGMSKNILEAILWWEKAAEQGIFVAQYNLVMFYYNGEDGVEKNYAKAKYWVEKAIDSDDHRAYSVKNKLREILKEIENK